MISGRAGSLIARILFLPLEESSRLYFSSFSASSPSSSPTFPNAPPTAPSHLPLTSLSHIARYLRLLLLLHTHLLLLFTLLAPSYTTPLLSLLLGPSWASTAGSTLRAYALSLPFLGLNGLLEAFFASFASTEWIARQSGAMGAAAAAFAVTVWGACGVGGLGMGAPGLVLANCANMAVRIAFATVFVRWFFEGQLSAAATAAAGKDATEQKEKERLVDEVKEELSWRSWTPNKATVLAFAGAGWVVRASEGRWAMVTEGVKGRAALRATVEHLGVGAVVGAGCLGVLCVLPFFSPPLLLVLARSYADRAVRRQLLDEEERNQDAPRIVEEAGRAQAAVDLSIRILSAVPCLSAAFESAERLQRGRGERKVLSLLCYSSSVSLNNTEPRCRTLRSATPESSESIELSRRGSVSSGRQGAEELVQEEGRWTTRKAERTASPSRSPTSRPLAPEHSRRYQRRG